METASTQRMETGGVYGAAQDIFKSDFLAELVHICDAETVPKLVVVDINIIQRQEVKNKDNFNPHFCLMQLW
jgi:hypothetical protein